MAGSVNKVILVGNVGNQPEIRTTQDGKEIANFSLATSESWRDKNTGEKRDKTEWHRVVIFNAGLANVVKQYVNKGSKLYIEGSLQTRKWVDNSGVEKYTTEVVLQGFNGNLTMLDNASSGSRVNNNVGTYNADQASAPAAQKQSPNNTKDFAMDDLDDDEIPF